MTIVVGAASHDGIVLAADSRTTTTYSGSDRHRIGTDTAEKVFDLGRFAVATYGAAALGPQTINGVMTEFIASNGPDGCTEVEECAKALGNFFTDRFNTVITGYTPVPGAWPLGFLVAGYDGAGVGHVWEVAVPGPLVTEQPLNTHSGGLTWRGQTDVVLRLIKGWDMAALERAGVVLDKAAEGQLAKLEYILMAPLTLRDAADFAAFLVRTTIDMQRFSDGTSLLPGHVPGCGGAVQLIAATAQGTKWLQRRPEVWGWRPGSAEGSVHDF